MPRTSKPLSRRSRAEKRNVPFFCGGAVFFLSQKKQTDRASETKETKNRMLVVVRSILVFVVVVVLVVVAGLAESTRAKRVIFTCTTFFDFARMDRLASFRRAVSSIYAHDHLHKPHAWLVVNEYSETPRADWTRVMRETFPWMVFVQKPRHLKGQAHSLNLILGAVSHYDYWVQWEDSWVAERPFLARARYHEQLERLATPGDTHGRWPKLARRTRGPPSGAPNSKRNVLRGSCTWRRFRVAAVFAPTQCKPRSARNSSWPLQHGPCSMACKVRVGFCTPVVQGWMHQGRSTGRPSRTIGSC